MPSLYIVAAQPSPPGRDTVRPGVATNDILNQEWVEFAVQSDRDLIGDQLLHLTFNDYCRVSGRVQLGEFASNKTTAGQRVRVHTGRGVDQWVGDTLHLYLNRAWFVWNNACGDRVILEYKGTEIDAAGYASNPPERVLRRIQGTDRLE